LLSENVDVPPAGGAVVAIPGRAGVLPADRTDTAIAVFAIHITQAGIINRVFRRAV